MATKEYSFYPGCSSQEGASSSNYLKSVNTMCEELDIKLNTVYGRLHLARKSFEKLARKRAKAERGKRNIR